MARKLAIANVNYYEKITNIDLLPELLGFLSLFQRKYLGKALLTNRIRVDLKLAQVTMLNWLKIAEELHRKEDKTVEKTTEAEVE